MEQNIGILGNTLRLYELHNQVKNKEDNLAEN